LVLAGWVSTSAFRLGYLNSSKETGNREQGTGNGRDYPRLQIFTIEDLLTKRKRPEYLDLSLGDLTFKKGEKEQAVVHQPELF
jgi:hypothetical protein